MTECEFLQLLKQNGLSTYFHWWLGWRTARLCHSVNSWIEAILCFSSSFYNLCDASEITDILDKITLSSTWKMNSAQTFACNSNSFVGCCRIHGSANTTITLIHFTVATCLQLQCKQIFSRFTVYCAQHASLNLCILIFASYYKHMADF